VEADPDDVDLGANMGNFLGNGACVDPRVRVVAVERSRSMNLRFVESLGLNRGFLDRVQLVRAFIGSRGPIQEYVMAADANYSDAEWITEDELMRRSAIRHIGFLKSDIERSDCCGLGANYSPLPRYSRARCTHLLETSQRSSPTFRSAALVSTISTARPTGPSPCLPGDRTATSTHCCGGAT
jgi:hypothetical protein